MIGQAVGTTAPHLSLVVGAAVLLAVFGAFISAERRGNSVPIVLTAVAVVVLDAAMYPGTADTQLSSIFHPGVGGHTVRLSQVVIALGVTARFLGRGLPRRAHPVALLWLLFFMWYLTAAVTGSLQGFNTHLVQARAMLVLEAGGMMLLTSGIPAREYLNSRGLPRLVLFSGFLAAVIFVMSAAGITVNASLPKLPLVGFGQMGSDAATLFSSIGVIGFAVAISGPKRQPLMLIASLVLVMAVFASPQRAARLGLAATLLVIIAAFFWPGRRRRSHRSGDIAVMATGLLAIAAASIFARSAYGNTQTSAASALPFSKYTTQAVSSSYRQGSVQSRFNEWTAAWPDVRAHLLLGNGLGKTFVHYDIGTAQFITYDITNNIGLDLLLRTGIVGLVLFVIALAATFRAALRVWQHTASDAISLIIIATAAVLGGFVAKGMVESVLNEFRLTPLLGFLVGLILAFSQRDVDATMPERTPVVSNLQANASRGL